MNALQTIRAYRHHGGWAFDDELKGLSAEPFVCGIPEIIDTVLDDPDAKTVTLTFSAREFPGVDRKLTRREPELGGYWYETGQGERGWLCPATLCFFEGFPAELFVKVDRKRA